ncbi:hypothetical protein CAEBREN_08079 [Caenorhabditis brenneri]|uniref:TRUD domain-containing protein n=1 Tax=Caenorhabditis brenneri TaxID=135651 RepID=G0N8Z6_CAEBE|nr:hypothetical protein CAEBREN_08079 [Caenorhabditis brenneri]
METEFGLTEYASGHTITPVSCLLKEMYSDFIVQEILADGKVLTIPSPDVILESTGAKKKDLEIEESIEKPNCIPDDILLALDERFSTKGTPVLVKVENLTKEERKSIHQFIRERYSGKLITETKEDGIYVSHGHTQSTRKRKNWDENIPKECHFTMCKENKETSFACQLLAKFLNVGPNNIKTHGIKDKRGVTSQRVSVTQVLESTILNLNSKLRGIKVFDCEYKNEPVKMGGHWGNRFSIVLRELPEGSEALLHERLETFQNTGFLNYFGTQRFGSRSSTTAEIGLAIAKRNWESAVKMILSNSMPDHLEGGSVGYAAKCFTETGDARKAFSKLKGAQAFATVEGNILKCLTKGGTWQKCITEAIPIQSRSLYVHAYQSLLWNKVASRRVREFGTRVHEYDVGADGKPLGEHSNHYDIHIPLPGENEAFKESYGSKWISELLEEDGLDETCFTSLQDKFSLGEASRPLFVEAKDLKWKFIRYENPRTLLQDGLQTRAVPESELKGSRLALEIQFSLISGSYATVALREVTGSDMGKKSMRNISLQNRDNDEAKEWKGEEKESERNEDTEVKYEESVSEDMSCVTIICPNAKRVQVKTTPMMLLRQVLEEACLKSGFDVNSHRLQTQSRKPVDPSLPFRLSGIANNATLEMTKKEAVSENAEIELAIQSGSGARHQKKVGVNVMLSNVLNDFTASFGEDLVSTNDGMVPCIVYMNKRYTGAELSINSLSSLGVTTGKCLIRHMRVKLSEAEISAMETKLSEEVERKKALDANFTKLKAENAERERLERIRQEAFDNDKEAREEREKEQLKAILPEVPDHQSNLMDTSEPQQRDVLHEVPERNPNSWSFDGPAFSRPAPQNTMRLDELNRLLERVDNSLTTAAMENRTDAMVNALADGGRITIAEVRNRAEAAMEEEKEAVEVFANPCDRQAVLFKKGAKAQEDEPMETEEFFEVGVDDIRNMQKDLRRAVRDQTQASFVSKEFLVKKNRQLKMEAYQHTVVRINVGEHVLQACFKTSERSSNLEVFLNSVFKTPGWKLLFTSMKVVTSETKNFVDLDLAPKSTLIASFGGHSVNANEVLQNVNEVTPEQADSISSSWLSVNKTFIPFNSTVNEDRKQKRHPLPASSASCSGPPAKSAMPKWMQTGKK